MVSRGWLLMLVAAGALAAAGLAGCTMIGQRPPIPIDVQSYCPETVYEPVCGADGHTYASECKAERAGVIVAYQGQCGAQAPTTASTSPPYPSQAPGLTPDPNAPFTPVPTPPADCRCPPGMDTVCGTDGRTYASTCFSDCAGVAVAHDGACTVPGATPTPFKRCNCPTVEFAVCGTDGNTYRNACYAQCYGTEVAYPTACD